MNRRQDLGNNRFHFRYSCILICSIRPSSKNNLCIYLLELRDELRKFAPERALELNEKLFLTVLREAPKGFSAALTGWRYEHLKAALDTEKTQQILIVAAGVYAQGKLPSTVAKLLSTGTLTALLKTNGKVQGIVAGDAFRRLVVRTLAKQFDKEMEDACAPYQYALSTGAGTECVAHMIRVALQADTENTLLSLDGIGAYDTMQRCSMLEKLYTLPKASAMLQFVLYSYGQPSEYLYYNDEGKANKVQQGQRRWTRRLLDAGTLCTGAARGFERADEETLTYRKAVHVSGRRVHTLQTWQAEALVRQSRAPLLWVHRCVSEHGKIKVYNHASVKLEGVDELQKLGPDAERVWVGDHTLPQEEQGVLVLGFPMGTVAYAEKSGKSKLNAEQKLLELHCCLTYSAHGFYCYCAQHRELTIT